jgi:hypothetical protein
LRKGAGETFTGEGILAITKALLENGVGYVGGYQGAPISHLMDVLADAEDLLSNWACAMPPTPPRRRRERCWRPACITRSAARSRSRGRWG